VGRKGLQRRAAAQNERIVSSISASAHDRYLRFLETYPSLATRVPQWMLASYFGVTPETISRDPQKARPQIAPPAHSCDH